MRILFTGGSSFTGMWFIQALAEAKASVTACFSSPYEEYKGLRLKRVHKALEVCQGAFAAPFGSDRFLEVIKSDEWDLLCHHASDVTNYKSPDFEVVAAVQKNTYNIKKVLEALESQGCQRVILTGSVFEPGEGGDLSVSPYGLSKGLTATIFEHYCKNVAKFVIPNPFGPFEEERFTTYLIKKWMQGQIPAVLTPSYIRDNIPVSLLAKAYAHFALEGKRKKCHPSFYKESVQAFAMRFSKEMASRLRLACPLDVKSQIDFTEPLERVNTETLDPSLYRWEEKNAWDQLAEFYREEYGK